MAGDPKAMVVGSQHQILQLEEDDFLLATRAVVDCQGCQDPSSLEAAVQGRGQAQDPLVAWAP